MKASLPTANIDDCCAECMHLHLCKEPSQIVAEAAQTCPVSENRGDQFSVDFSGYDTGS